MNNTIWRQQYAAAILNGEIEKAKQIVTENAEHICLLKFFKGTALQLSTVLSEKFWLSNAKNFNDPYDSLSLVNVRSKSKYNRYNPEERKLAFEEYENQAKSNSWAYDTQSGIFVTCFTETLVTNLHMWSYYADEHKGFCVEYSLKKLIDKGICILPVVYLNKWNADRSSPSFSMQAALIKGKEWAHENEWRIVTISPENKHANGIPCDGIAPEKIYVGCRDRKHIDDNWTFYRSLAEHFDACEKIRSFVWDDMNRKISLDEIVDAYSNHKKKTPIYSMALSENEFGLRTVELHY